MNTAHPFPHLLFPRSLPLSHPFFSGVCSSAEKNDVEKNIWREEKVRRGSGREREGGRDGRRGREREGELAAGFDADPKAIESNCR